MAGNTAHKLSHLFAQCSIGDRHERYINLLLRHLPIITYSLALDEEFGVFACDGSVRQITGYETSDFLSDKCFWYDRVHPTDQERVITELSTLYEAGYLEQRYRFKCSDGRYIHVIDVKEVVFNPNGEPSHIAGLWYDDTERQHILDELQAHREDLESLVSQRTEQLQKEIRIRKKAEQAIRSQQEKLGITLRAIADGVIATDPTSSITLMNPAAERCTGWSENQAFNKNLAVVFHLVSKESGESLPGIVGRVRATGHIVDGEGILVAKDGSESQVQFAASPIYGSKSKLDGVVIVFRDVSSVRRLREEMLRRQKLESVGTLAGGIAHDFNNLLAGIMGNVSLAQDSDVPAADRAKVLGMAEDACVKAKSLTERLLTFSKGGLPCKKVQSITDIIESAADLTLSGKPLQLEMEPDSRLPYADVDEGQMLQVFSNIFLNAAEAMPEGGLLRVHIEVESLDVDNEQQLRAGQYLKVQVEDSGPGVSEIIAPKIFDPYFSTKPHASGLGLATAYSIVSNHNGSIGLSTSGAGGACFDIYLPVSEPQEHVGEAIEPVVHKDKRESAVKGKVLVLDDEQIIREMVEMMLTRLGYEVVTVTKGEDVLTEYTAAEEQGVPFDLVIADLTVDDGMGGKETTEQLRKLYPQVKVIVSSGYSKDPVMANYADYGFCDVIAKPYNLQRVREVLESQI